MASAKVVGGKAPYLTVLVACSAGRSFEQQIYCDKTGAARDTFLQAYADDYEAGLPPAETD